MSFFDQIPLHTTSLFKFESVPHETDHKYIKSYYHHLTDFIPYHTHDFYEINIIYSGVGKHKLENREILTQRGDVFIIPPNMKHGYSCKDELTVYHILLSNSFIAVYSPLLEKMRGYNMIFNIEPLFREHIEKTYYLKSEDIPFEQLKHHISLIESYNRADNCEPTIIAHVLSLIALLSNAIFLSKPLTIDTLPNEQVLTVLESLEYIEKHYDDKIDFKYIAHKSAYSYSTYLRYFKKLTGTTPAKYQTKCKIKNAANMLLNTNESILSIALTCGFYDSSHFIKEFIREKQISPSKFRKEKIQPNNMQLSNDIFT